MSPLLSRILLAILMLPLAATVYITTVFCIGELSYWRYREEWMFGAASVITMMCIAVYWLLLWRKVISWTTERFVITFVLTGSVLLFGVGVGIVFARFEEAMGWFMWGLVTTVLWLPGTVLVWRETSAERADRVRNISHHAITCPRCGYNMTGLRESTCPECGSVYTIDELLAAQREHAARELEQ